MSNIDRTGDRLYLDEVPPEWQMMQAPRLAEPRSFRELHTLGAHHIDVGNSQWVPLKLHSYPVTGQSLNGWWPPTQDLHPAIPPIMPPHT